MQTGRDTAQYETSHNSRGMVVGPRGGWHLAAPVEAAREVLRGTVALLLLPRLHHHAMRLRRQVPRFFIRLRAAAGRAAKTAVPAPAPAPAPASVPSTSTGGQAPAATGASAGPVMPNEGPPAWLQELRATAEEVGKLGLAAIPTEGGSQRLAAGAVSGCSMRAVAEALALGVAGACDSAAGAAGGRRAAVL